MANEDRQTYNFAVGDTVIGVDCRQAAFARGLAKWFDHPSAPGEPHIVLDTVIVGHEDAPTLPNSLLTTKVLGDDGAFDIADGLITGSYDAAARRGTVSAKAVLLEGRLMRIWEQILYQGWVSAAAAAGHGGFLIHSSAVIADGQGFLFVGPSEAGKSTAALNSSAWHVLSDEMNLVTPGPDGPEVVGTLFNGTFREKAPGRAPLAGVFLLNQAPHHALGPVGRAEAVAALAAEFVPPVGLDQVPDETTIPAMIDTAAAFVEQVEVLRLDLLPDPGFWTLISEHFGLTPTAPGPNRGN